MVAMIVEDFGARPQGPVSPICQKLSDAYGALLSPMRIIRSRGRRLLFPDPAGFLPPFHKRRPINALGRAVQLSPVSNSMRTEWRRV